ncbi:MAG: type II toxin-antitoxin system HicA family toxin [SAR202 cluster bacterium]|nr:type II toxin-antitoxin system HicA family toxin [SAR202 cluster bacterium]
MPKRYQPRELNLVLEHLGWRQTRQRGRHAILTKAGAYRNIAVPMSSREVSIGTFYSILKTASLTREDFDNMAEEVL